jgi:putative ABC transport system permease protein
MFRHYLVTAARSLVHHRLYSYINVAGLSIGLAAAILIVLYVRDELSYDKWIPDTGDLYRLEVTFHIPGRAPLPIAMAPFPVVSAIPGQIPQVKAVTHVMPETMTVNIEDHQFRETVTFVDPNFFRVIKLPLVEGDPAHALAQPESVVLSQSAARKFFGTLDPIGKILALGQNENSACGANDSACLSTVYPLIVTGVLRDLPHNTQLVADLVVPNTSRADEMTPLEKVHDWTSGDRDYGYVELTPGADPAAVLAELKPILDRSFDPRKFGINLSFSEFEQYRLTPFKDVHLTSDSDQYGGMTPGGSWTTVYGLGAIALLIVLIACCNFTNLATARATLRAREIAVRKVGGAKRGELIVQFLVEAVLFSVASLAIAVSLVEVLLPLYDRFLGRPIALHYLADWELVAAFVAGAIAVGLLSGLYPAVVLSAFRPAQSLRSGVYTYGSPGLIRSALVVAQFAISIGLGIAALVVLRQVDFARKADLGFDRDGIVVIRGVSQLTPAARKDLAAELRSDPQIIGVAYSNAVPFDDTYVENDEIRTAGQPESIAAQVMNIGPEFPSLYGMKLLAGRFLSDERGEDLSAHGVVHNMLINATGAHRLGFSADDAVGRRVTVIGAYTATVVGVLSDAKFEGMRNLVRPTLYYLDTADRHATADLSLRIRGDHAADTPSFIDRTWHSFAPGTAIDRYYLADAFDSLFQPAEKQGTLLGLSVGIAIFIACLGLFGLAVFTAERRTKEIGVRKIAGARTYDILRLMLWRISVPVLVANLIAWPVAYHYLTRWLEGYAYRISLSPVYFLAGAVAALVIAWATVFAHTLHLARANPVHALRYE